MHLDARQAHLRVALFLGLFLILHFATHFSGLGGLDWHVGTLATVRSIYRIPVVEVLLIVALAAQIWLGIRLIGRIARRRKKGFWHHGQKYSGIVLAIFIILHTSAAMLARWLSGLDTNFYWAAGTLTLSPIRYWFAPYYAAAIIALVTHLLAALHFRKPKRWHKPALLVGPIIALTILTVYGGGLFPVELPVAHQDYFSELLIMLRFPFTP